MLKAVSISDLLTAQNQEWWVAREVAAEQGKKLICSRPISTIWVTTITWCRKTTSSQTTLSIDPLSNFLTGKSRPWQNNHAQWQSRARTLRLWFRNWTYPVGVGRHSSWNFKNWSDRRIRNSTADVTQKTFQNDPGIGTDRHSKIRAWKSQLHSRNWAS